MQQMAYVISTRRVEGRLGSIDHTRGVIRRDVASEGSASASHRQLSPSMAELSRISDTSLQSVASRVVEATAPVPLPLYRGLAAVLVL